MPYKIIDPVPQIPDELEFVAFVYGYPILTRYVVQEFMRVGVQGRAFRLLAQRNEPFTLVSFSKHEDLQKKESFLNKCKQFTGTIRTLEYGEETFENTLIIDCIEIQQPHASSRILAASDPTTRYILNLQWTLITEELK